jgi:dephospho-CoA kinase
MLIGLTGRNGAGKGRVAEWLAARGLRTTSLSDALRAELARQGKAPTRDNLIAGGHALRAEHGPGALAKLALAEIEAAGGDWVVDSVRNPGEVEVLRRRSDFRLVEVTAPVEVRFARVQRRARPGDATDLAAFLRQEEAELASTDPAAQRLLATAALADLRLVNDGSEAELAERLAALWPQLAEEGGA